MYKSYADLHRRPSPDFDIGSLVWLSRKNISTVRPIDKLDHRKIGPFKIIEKIGGAAYKLDLPPTLRIHNVFHCSLLSPYHENSFEGRLPVEPDPIIVDEHLELEVEEVLDSRIYYGKLQYLVQWKGQSVQERTWEPVNHLKNAPRMIEEFHKNHPERPTSAQKKSKDSWDSLSLLRLRVKCAEKGLKVRGSKPELVERLSKFKFSEEEEEES